MTGAPRASCVRAPRSRTGQTAVPTIPLPRRSRGVHGEQRDAVTRIARTPVLLPVGTLYHGTGKHCSVGKVLTTVTIPLPRHSWRGVKYRWTQVTASGDKP